MNVSACCHGLDVEALDLPLRPRDVSWVERSRRQLSALRPIGVRVNTNGVARVQRMHHREAIKALTTMAPSETF
jgi:hypothetical protein